MATVSNPSANLQKIPILNRLVEQEDVEPVAVPAARALAPRFGGQSLFYLSSRGAGDGLWRYEGGEAFEVWNGGDEALLEPTAISPDVLQATLVLKREGRRQLHLITVDGTQLRPIAESIEAQGSAAWSPDGEWIATGGSDADGPGLFKIPVGGGEPVRLFSGPSFHPVWSPHDNLIAFSGPRVALWAPLLAVRPDGTPVDLPEIRLRQEGKRYRFLPDGRGLVYMQGSFPWQDFWLLNTETLQSRQLSRLSGRAAMQTFDISPDGSTIVFEELHENSDIVLIDLRPLEQ